MPPEPVTSPERRFVPIVTVSPTRRSCARPQLTSGAAPGVVGILLCSSTGSRQWPAGGGYPIGG